MSTDLQRRLEEAVGDVEPVALLDHEELWRRGRRQRLVRKATPVVAVLLVTALGLGAIATLAGGAGERDPLDGIEDGRATDAGWARLESGQLVEDDDLVVASEDDVEVVTPLLGHPNAPYGVDIRDDGAVVTVLQDLERGGIVVRFPGDEGWVRLGMPVPFLTDPSGYAITTVQWGPDGRIYVTGTAPSGVRRGLGLSQVVVLEEDGTVVGARENDDGQTTGFLFADGYAWQRQTSAAGRERWQPVVEVGGSVLQMPDQRAGDREDVVAPDGMALTYDLPDVGGPRFEARIGEDRTVTWRAPDDAGVGLWQQTPAGLRVAATLPTRPAGGPLGWLSDGREPDGVVLHAVRADGRIAAVHLPAEVVQQPGMLVNGADGAIGGDDRVYWVSHTPDGPMLFRYRHPIP